MKNKLSANNKRYTKAVPSGSGCINKPEPVSGDSRSPKETPPNKRRRTAIRHAFKEKRKIGLVMIVLTILIVMAVVTIKSAKHNDASADELFTEEHTEELEVSETYSTTEVVNEEETETSEPDQTLALNKDIGDDEDIDEENTDEEDIDDENTDDEDIDDEDIDDENDTDNDYDDEDIDDEDDTDNDYDNDSEYCDYDDGYDEGYDIGYDEGYNIGYDEGYEEGQSGDYDKVYDKGYDDGYEEGQSDGYDEGYDIGYNEGYEAGYEAAYAEIFGDEDEFDEDESDEDEDEDESDEDESDEDDDFNDVDGDEEETEPAFVYEKEDKESAKAFLKVLNKTQPYILYTNNYKPHTNVSGNIAVVNLLNNLNLLKTNGEGQSYIAYVEEDIYIQSIENATVYVGRDEDDKRTIVKQNTNGKVVYVKEPDTISDDIEERISDISSAASDVTSATVAENKDAIACVMSLLNNGKLKSGNVVAIEITANDIGRVQQLCNKNKDIGANIILNLVDIDDDILTIYNTINASGNAGTNTIWNFGDYSGAICINSTFTGVIVAPDGTVICNAVINGRVIADTVIQGKGIQTPIEQPELEQPVQMIDESFLTDWSALIGTPPVEENLVVNDTETFTNLSDFLPAPADSIIISSLDNTDDTPLEIVKTGENTFLILSIVGLCILSFAAYWYIKKRKK